MNNTSAYANVLLKSPSLTSPVLKTAEAVTPKRDYDSDNVSADFQQTFKDVRDNQKRQDDKVTKSANPKKAAQVERHSDAKNAKEIKGVKATHDTAAKQKTADDSADINRNSIGSDVVREQPVQQKSKDICADKVAEDESVQEATNLAADINPDVSQDALMAANAVNGMDFGVAQSALTLGAELTPTTEALVVGVSDTANEPLPTQEIPVSAGINAAASSDPTTLLSPLLASPVTEAPIAVSVITPEVIDVVTPVSPLLANSESATILDVAAVTPIEPNAIPLETENLANVSLSPNASVKVENSGEAVSQPLVDDPLLPPNLSQQLADSSQAIAVHQSINPADAQVLAAGVMVSGASVKPLPSQVALTEVTGVSDEARDLFASLVPEASAPVKVVPASNLAVTNNANNPEVTTAQVQMNASKTAFEKTLQAIVSPNTSRADDMAAPTLNSSSTNSVTNPLMDSLMRGVDQQTPAARSFVVQTAVPVPVGQPQWSQAVGEKVLWLAAQNVSSAEINLHPKDLGPIQVRVSVNQEQTTVSFTSHHAVVREVLDQNLNRLRDMFSEQGLNLVNVDVSDKSFSRQQGDAQDQKGQGGSQDVASEEETAIAMSAIVQQRLVDHYA